jgi:hypothetical protein
MDNFFCGFLRDQFPQKILRLLTFQVGRQTEAISEFRIVFE